MRELIEEFGPRDEETHLLFGLSCQWDVLLDRITDGMQTIVTTSRPTLRHAISK